MSAGEVILDVSRLLSRARHQTPSGVDRVEMAYARGLQARLGERLGFAAVHPFGNYGRLSRARTLAFLDATEARWASARGKGGPRPIAEVMPTLLNLLPTRPRPGPNSVYVQSSPHHLTKPDLVKRILAHEQARFLCFVHDLIPIEYPEYARPDGARLHQQRVDTITRFADSVIVNSVSTAKSLKPFLLAAWRSVDVRVALLGTEEIPYVAPLPSAAAERPYFLCLGTIEPRKNHLLLLNLWRAMAQQMDPAAIPRLIIVGRRGWENEQVVDMLERCPGLKGHVEELNGCSDERMHALLRGARALVLPSFAEGYGMPVAEALSVGTPVICSDLPALHEAGGAAPDFLDPLDGLGWEAAILDHARAGPMHHAQLERMRGWNPPTWHDHISILCDAIEALQR
ncbi:glycosyltransferase family 1 protein [Sphingomonas sp. AAP5]|uniref:glycosyltransferase family 4 protein n=1 Tax=Sphingomonas sp. AAP5 TaxID=1523415 RepID=UPI0010571C5F|nr:glycosyltransferase family 1 protein [Sphingomonas sp. AAP5]QBM76821.1 glycosyltransferase family 1 protein [Sphingomonas sp. AAP5]